MSRASATVPGRESIPAAAAIALHAAALWSVWRWYSLRILDGSDDPWGVLALMTAFSFLYLQARWRAVTVRSLVLPLAGLSLYGVVSTMAPPLVSAIVGMASLALLFSLLLDDRTLHFGMLGLLVLSLPLIASLQFYLGFPVRLLTSEIAAFLLRAIDWPVQASGTALLWAGETVAVDAPCAGIKMLWTGMYLTFALACFGNLSNFGTWAAYSLGMLSVFSCNILRTCCLFFTESGIVANPGWAHQTIGLGAFLVCAVLILCAHCLLRRSKLCIG